MTASRCLCTVGAGLVPALCSRLFFWADTPVPPLRLTVFHFHLSSFICSLFSVLCYLLGGHAGTAPTALFSFGHPQGMPLRYLYSVLCTLYSFGRTCRYRPYGVVLFWAPTRDAPTTHSFPLSTFIFHLSSFIFHLYSVLCTLLSNKIPIFHHQKWVFHTKTPLKFFSMTFLRYLRNRIIDKLKTLCIYPLEPSFKEAVMKSSVT